MVGVDLAESMHARALSKARAQELENIEFQQVQRPGSALYWPVFALFLKHTDWFNPQAHCTGMLFLRMLTILPRRQSRSRGCRNGCTAERQGGIEEVNFPAGTVDCVMCCSGFAYLNNTVAALRRYRSWLRPGGRCIHRLFIGCMRGPYPHQWHADVMLV